MLSFNAGYADAAGFLALHGLFTAHVTGNFVTLGASWVDGSEGGAAKLLALPLFCVVVFLMRLLHFAFLRRAGAGLHGLLALECTLLAVAAVLAWRCGPFADGDGGAALAMGMVLVAAMAIQNAVQRIYLAHLPPTTIMTGTTTQIMIDAADWLHGVPPEQSAAVRARMARMARSVAAFGAGCGMAALAFHAFGTRCFLPLPLLTASILAHPQLRPQTP